MSTVQRKASLPALPSPSDRYSVQNEAQFRHILGQAMEQLSGAIFRPHMVSDTLASGNNNNYPLGEYVTAVRVSADAAGSTITGVAGGYDAREIRIINVSGNTLSIAHQDTNSDAVNRILLTGGATLNLSQNQMVDIQYDPVTERWRETNTT